MSAHIVGHWIPRRRRTVVAALQWWLCLALMFPVSTHAQRNWLHYGQDPGGSKYSSLAQINTTNVAKLQRAWTVHTGDSGGFFSSSPLVIDNVLYFTSSSGIWALEAHTGKQIWKRPAKGAARRGVSYWQGDAQHQSRILATIGQTLVALDPRTGASLKEFGTDGVVAMGTNWGSPPAIYKNLVFTGGGRPTVRAWDARTGALIWTFNLVAQPGDPGHETWENDSWKDATGTNVWAFLSVDAENGLVLAPVSQAGYDYAGVERPGNNLYADSVVAIDANTGKLRWYQQTVHHDIWDYDLPAQPTLIDITRNGKRIPAVVQHTKTGMLFIYNRLTGEPVFPIEERAVPQSTIPGEKTAPTQPFTIKSLQLARLEMNKGELYNLTPEHATFCKNLWEQNNVFNDGPYTPWVLKESGRTALIFPGAVGGGNWGGVASDPTLQYVFANVMNTGQWGFLENVAAGAGPGRRPASPAAGNAAVSNVDESPRPSGNTYTKSTPFGVGNPARFRFWNPETSWPCQNPPWGELFAINASTGDVAWRVPLGSFAEAESQGVRNAGTPNMGGAIATAGGLVFIGATLDGKFRAFESKTGKVLWEASVDAPAHSIPATYLGGDGRQYIVIPAGGGGFLQGPTGDSIIAFALPDVKPTAR
jgi:quinoprotein glucose dehydrogenase